MVADDREPRKSVESIKKSLDLILSETDCKEYAGCRKYIDYLAEIAHKYREERYPNSIADLAINNPSFDGAKKTAEYHVACAEYALAYTVDEQFESFCKNLFDMAREHYTMAHSLSGNPVYLEYVKMIEVFGDVLLDYFMGFDDSDPHDRSGRAHDDEEEEYYEEHEIPPQNPNQIAFNNKFIELRQLNLRDPEYAAKRHKIVKAIEYYGVESGLSKDAVISKIAKYDGAKRKIFEKRLSIDKESAPSNLSYDDMLKRTGKKTD